MQHGIAANGAVDFIQILYNEIVKNATFFSGYSQKWPLLEKFFHLWPQALIYIFLYPKRGELVWKKTIMCKTTQPLCIS